MLASFSVNASTLSLVSVRISFGVIPNGIHHVVVSSSGLRSPVLRNRFCLIVNESGASATSTTGKPIVLIHVLYLRLVYFGITDLKKVNHTMKPETSFPEASDKAA